MTFQSDPASQEPKPKLNRGGLIASIFLFGLIALAMISAALNPPTPEQIKQQQALIQAQQAEQQADRAQADEYCRLVPLCPTYSKARQDCAVAGNYDRCMEIKLGAEPLSSECTDDGKPLYVPKKAPAAFACNISNLFAR